MGEGKTTLQRHLDAMMLLHRHLEKMKKVLRVILNSKLDSYTIIENIKARLSTTKGYSPVVNEALQEFVARLNSNSVEAVVEGNERKFNLFFLNVLKLLRYLPDKSFADLEHLIDDTKISDTKQKLLMIAILDGLREADAIEDKTESTEENSAPEQEVN